MFSIIKPPKTIGFKQVNVSRKDTVQFSFSREAGREMNGLTPQPACFINKWEEGCLHQVWLNVAEAARGGWHWD